MEECFDIMMKYQQILSQNLVFNRLLQGLPYPDLNKRFQVSSTQIEDTYQYFIQSNSQKVVWHVNFADTDLFGFCLQDLFAQDEIQCAEHPLLYSMRTAINELQIKDLKNKTQEFDRPTPILIYNIPRQVKFDLSPSSSAPKGIYGRNFKQCSYDTIKQKATIYKFDNPNPNTNLIAMVAMSYGYGMYTQDQIKYLFYTAFLAFEQAKLFSKIQTSNQDVKICIHTGNWGCGAFGNNMEIIAIIQHLAAFIAQIDEIHYHTFNKQGTQEYQKGMQTYANIFNTISLEQPTENYISQWVEEIFKRNYQWGQSDFN